MMIFSSFFSPQRVGHRDMDYRNKVTAPLIRAIPGKPNQAMHVCDDHFHCDNGFSCP